MKAFFAGSFNPFTIGHEAVVRRALAFCENIVIGIGYNITKCDDTELNTRIEAIRKIYNHNPNVLVTSYTGLTVDAARQLNCDILLRGVRSVKDFEYERDLADVNLRIAGIDTIILIAEPEMSAISSSVVRELAHYGHDVSHFLPK